MSGNDGEIRRLAGAIAICRVLPPASLAEMQAALVARSEAIARAVFNAPETAWQNWEEHPPSPEDGPIVGRDCLGYFHLATHLVGGNDPMWVEAWMRVPFEEGDED